MYSINEYTSDGVTSVYSFSFQGAYPGYLDELHINVYYDDVLVDRGDWSLTTDTSITLNPVPVNGVKITIKRESSIESRLVNYTGGTILSERNLDISNTQLLYLIQELADRIEILEGVHA
jgi:hypothetical protein